MSRFSPLRYPGGKAKLAPYLSHVISLNKLEGGHYVEPFAGGAAVALDLLFSERVRHIHINDVDLCIHAFWHSVIYETDAMIAKIQATNVDIDAWLAAREVRRSPSNHSRLDLGFSTFFLSRTNVSGILNGGAIGGLNQNGAWKIDCRFNKDELISRIRRIGFFRSRISLHNTDALKFLTDDVPSIPEESFLYIDPPYYVKGAYLYKNHYEHHNHVDLAGAIRSSRKQKWIVSYDNVPEISKIYRDFDQEVFSIGYSARSYGKGSEIMIFSNELVRPRKVFCSEKERNSSVQQA